MTRKDFFKTLGGGAAGGILIMLGIGCKGDNPTSPGTPSGDQRSFSSTTAQGHTHSVTITRSEIESPPQGGITKTTTSGGGHTHSVSMTQQQLSDVRAGQTVTVTDTNVSGHTHDYQISRWF